MSDYDKDRMWRVHICFPGCKDPVNDTIESGFIIDTRPECDENSTKSILCLEPNFPCENMYTTIIL